jgi:hypothetical protein
MLGYFLLFWNSRQNKHTLVISLYLERRYVLICVLSARLQNAIVTFATCPFPLSAFEHFISHWNVLGKICFFLSMHGKYIQNLSEICQLCTNCTIHFLCISLTNNSLICNGEINTLISYNKNQIDALFLKFILTYNSTCFGQIYCPSSSVLILYSQQLLFFIIQGVPTRAQDLKILEKSTSVPAETWGKFVGYCVPQLIAVWVYFILK